MKRFFTILAVFFFSISLSLTAQDNFNHNLIYFNKSGVTIPAQGVNPKPGNDLVIKKVLAGYPMEKRVDSILVVRDSDTIVYKFAYNSYGYAVLYIAYNIKNNIATAYKKGEYEYNANGKIASEASFYWGGSGWNNDSKTTYTYSEDGLGYSTIALTGSGSQWVNSGRYTYTYNSSGKMTSSLNESWATDKWVNYSKSELFYNSYMDITSRKNYLWQNQSWVFRSQELYTYDSKRNNVLKESYNYSGGTISAGIKDSMIFNSSNYLVETVTKKYSAPNWSNSRRVTNTLDQRGNVLILTRESWVDTGWVNSSQVNSIYDNNNRIIEQTARAWSNLQWVNSSKDSYTYNSKGKQLTDTFEIFYENAWGRLYIATNKYDMTDTLLLGFHMDRWTVGSSSAGSGFVNVNVDNNYLTSFGVSGTDVNIVYTQVPVPVELSSFSGKSENGGVLLQWQTATETNNKGFSVERKTKKTNWADIGFEKGHGTTASKNDYAFTDKNAPSGEVYYRLKQVDFDGAYKYSDEIRVNTGIVTGFLLGQNYPNPFNPSTVICFSIPEKGVYSLKVYNMIGQLVATLVSGELEPGNYSINFNAVTLSSGVYVYQMTGKLVNVTRKMLLQK